MFRSYMQTEGYDKKSDKFLHQHFEIFISDLLNFESYNSDPSSERNENTGAPPSLLQHLYGLNPIQECHTRQNTPTLVLDLDLSILIEQTRKLNVRMH